MKKPWSAFSKRPAEAAATAAAALLLALFFLRAMHAAGQQSLSYDEPPHLAAGLYYLLDGAYFLNPEHPPLAKLLSGAFLRPLSLEHPDSTPAPGEDLNEWQWELARRFLAANRPRLATVVFYARLPLALLGVLLGGLILAWAGRLFGRGPALLALFLYASCPAFLAHAPLVTTDVPLTLFAVAAFYFFRRLLADPGDRRALLCCALAVGLALATKYSALLCLPPAFLLVIAHRRLWPLPGQRPGRPPGIRLAGAAALALLVLLLSYRLAGAAWYYRGLVELVYQQRHFHWVTFLNGALSENGFRSYFAWALLLKTPPAALLIIALGGVAWRRIPRDDRLCLAYPALVFFAAATFSGRQLGIRYILPVYAFLYVGVAAFAAGPLPSLPRAARRLVPALLVLWLGLESAFAHPFYLGYFNQLGGGARGGWHHLLDSNIDWGQDLKHLARFLREEGDPALILSYDGSYDPALYGIRYQPLLMSAPEEGGRPNPPAPERELLAVSVNNFQGYNHPYPFFEWLRDEPLLAQVGTSFLVYDITASRTAREHLRRIYEGTGRPALAAREAALGARRGD